MRYSDVTGVPIGGEFLHKIKQQNEVQVFSYERLMTGK